MSNDLEDVHLVIERDAKKEKPNKEIKEIKESKHCWVCYQSDEDKDVVDNEWVKPCRCKGTTKWVHQQCLQRWIDEKQKNNSTTKVSCAQCKTEYILVFPPFGGIVYVLELCDRFLYNASPFACATIFISSVYWFALSYGAVTILQVFGQDEGKMAMEQADPMTLLIGLPSIPVFLVLGKFIRWEDTILKFWRRYHHFFPLINYVVGSPPENPRELAELSLYYQDGYSDLLSITRMISGALFLPTIANLVGHYLFNGVSSKFHRTIMGGLTFIVIKGMFKIYLRQQQYIRQSNRKVLNYIEDGSSDTLIKQQEHQEQSMNYSELTD